MPNAVKYLLSLEFSRESTLSSLFIFFETNMTEGQTGDETRVNWIVDKSDQRLSVLADWFRLLAPLIKYDVAQSAVGQSPNLETAELIGNPEAVEILSEVRNLLRNVDVHSSIDENIQAQFRALRERAEALRKTTKPIPDNMNARRDLPDDQ